MKVRQFEVRPFDVRPFDVRPFKARQFEDRKFETSLPLNDPTVDGKQVPNFEVGTLVQSEMDCSVDREIF